ncbi:MAG: efflux RND transporter permease subunit [Phycisphaerales bacterium]|nr:MAG: efflux RND transporter permease subunit [Phycisphaerales bacterium]
MTSLPRLSVRNRVVVNLLMWGVLAGGGYSALTLVREMFPESRPNLVLITTPYPGATPSEVEKGITLKIEEQIKDVEHVEKIESTIREGLSTIVVELESGFDDINQVVDDVKARIDSIPREDFPREAEETVVRKFEPKWPVISIAVFGDLDDRALKQYGERVRDDLLAIPGITDVVVSGTRKDEISVEVRPDKLLEYGLSFMDVGAAIEAANLDLPGGRVRTPGANVALRTLGEEDRGEDLRDIVVRSDPAGRQVRLCDVARVIDGFEDTDTAGRFQGKPSVNVVVYKTPEQDAIRIASQVRALVHGKLGEPLQRSWRQRWRARLADDGLQAIYERAAADPYPPAVRLGLHTDLSRFIEGRLDLLQRNGLWGLLFVGTSLVLFLHWRVALWVMMGLVFSVFGVAIAMKALGVTLNLMTMFGLIVVLGMLVDDAIIIGENVYTKVEAGLEPELAAVQGAEEVTWPVVIAITTTIAAFLPLMFIEGRVGDWMGVLPVIVMLTLSISLFEALAILPLHLAHGLRPLSRRGDGLPGALGPIHALLVRYRRWVAHVGDATIRRCYERVIRRSLEYRYVTAAVFVAAIVVCACAVAAGHVPFVMLQKMDAETLTCELKMGVNAPVEQTRRAALAVEEAVMALPELKSVYTLLGASLPEGGMGAAQVQAHLAQMFIELTDVRARDRSSEEVLRELRERTAGIPGVRFLTFTAMEGGPAGAAIHVEITGDRLDDLVAVSAAIREELSRFAGVHDVVDDFDAGRREIQIELLDSATALGLTTRSLATQVRAAFHGLETRKVQRGREDVKIMVRYPLEHRRSVYDLESMYVATPAGTLAPIVEVARITEGTGFATLRRIDQDRAVAVTADVDENVTNAELVIQSLAAAFPKWTQEYPGVSLRFAGQKLEFRKSFGSLKRDFLIALALIYFLLAGLFRSYVRPLVVMTAIPFGFIGVVIGHKLMGYPITILSLIGMVALTGIVVNDSLILVTFVGRRVEEGRPLFEAVLEAGRSRLRAILLTTITTVLGLAPLMAEQSFQARFLIPMAISIAFGIAFGTVLTLVGVPAFYLIAADVTALLRRAAAAVTLGAVGGKGGTATWGSR